MARTSKKAKEIQQSVKMAECIWNAGIYARLSVDMYDRKNESIDTQIEIAKKYIEKSEDIVLAECYTDLGKTGTNFEREGFEKLMADIRRHKINCVIVKDFSRFGRNYIETGNYMEKIFPFFNVRFISVSDGYDSHRKHGENDALAIHLKNVVNELYARDCAEKVRTIKRSKMEQGCYVGGVPSYGYHGRWINGKKVLFPEEGASDVVRKIYHLFDEGKGIRQIISWLYEQHVHRPSEYKKVGHVYSEEGDLLKQWSDQTIRTILTNPVYIGTLVQIRAGDKIYRNGERHHIEPDEVVTVEHTHEPIISEDLFYRVLAKIEEKRKTELKKKRLPEDTLPEDIYKDLIDCGECGGKLRRICGLNKKSYQVSIRSYSYGCPNIQRIDALKCDSHFISFHAVNQIVMETLRKEFHLSGVRMKTLVDYNRKQAEQKEKKAEKRKEDIQAHIRDLDIAMSSIYIQYKTGRIDKEAFLDLKVNRETEKSNLIKELSKQEINVQHIRKEAEEMNQFIRCLWKGKDRTELDSQAVRCLVKKITVYKDRRVEIVFNFSKEQIERCRKEARGR